MTKIVKVKGLCNRELQARILAAGEGERETLLERVAAESGWMIAKMRAKGYELEGTVFGIYGIFTRGPARGTVRLGREAATA